MKPYVSLICMFFQNFIYFLCLCQGEFCRKITEGLIFVSSYFFCLLFAIKKPEKFSSGKIHLDLSF